MAAVTGAAAAWWLAASMQAHHSFAMYDLGRTYVMTGVVTRVDPNPNHLQLFFAPLNDARDQVEPAGHLRTVNGGAPDAPARK